LGGREALGKEDFEVLNEVGDALGQIREIGVGETSKDVVGEVLAGVLFRSDAQSGADELFAEVADAAGDAVMAGGGTS